MSGSGTIVSGADAAMQIGKYLATRPLPDASPGLVQAPILPGPDFMCSSDDSFTLPPTCHYNSCLDMMATSAPHLLHTIRISIIIPVYNEGQFIEEVLCRVQAVNLKNKFQIEKELIVVDDGSVDGTREWLIEMQERQATGFSEAEVQGAPDESIRQQFKFLQRRVKAENRDPSLQGKPARGPIAVLETVDRGAVTYESGDPE